MMIMKIKPMIIMKMIRKWNNENNQKIMKERIIEMKLIIEENEMINENEK